MIVKELVTISPKKAGQNTKLTCATNIAGKRFVLTQNWKMILESQLGKGEFVNEKIMEIPFSRANNVFRFAFDLYPEREKPKEKDHVDDKAWANERELEKDKYNAAFQFFAKHQQVQVVGMVNKFLKGEPMFVMNFVNHVSVNNCNTNDKIVKAYQKVSDMTLQEKRDLALYFMPSLYGKRHSEIKDKLTNLETGLLMKQPYLDDLLAYDPKNTTVAMHTYVNKAIQMDILNRVGNGYNLLGNYVGAETPEIVGYFLKDPASYNNVLVKQVNEREKMPEDDLIFRDEDLAKRLAAVTEYQRNKDMAPGEWTAQLEQTRAEAKAMGIMNVEGKTYTKLKEEMARTLRGDHKYISPHKAIQAAGLRGITEIQGESLEQIKERMKDAGIKGLQHIKTVEQAHAKIEQLNEQAGNVVVPVVKEE